MGGGTDNVVADAEAAGSWERGGGNKEVASGLRPTAVPRLVSDRLLAECLGRNQAHAELGRMCDELGGRLSGSEAGRAAEDRTAALLGKWGLEAVRFEALTVPTWQRGALSVEVIEPGAWRVHALAHGMSPAQADVGGRVIDAGHGEADDYDALAARDASGAHGAVVLCDEGVRAGRRPLHRSEKLRLAIDRGAAGLMISSSASGYLARTGTCHADEAPIPSLGIAREDGLRLRRGIGRGAQPRVRITMRNALGSGEVRNVIADIAGRQFRSEIVLAGAHLDSWDVAQGATDNGLGVAIVLEAARALSALAADGLRPRRTLRFALWAAEEIGLLGSEHHAAAATNELDDYTAVMNFDMTGDPHGFIAPGREGEQPLLQSLAGSLRGLGIQRSISSEPSLHSDHQPFMLRGVPILGLQASLPGDAGHYYHSIGDTFEKVSLAAMGRAAAVAAHCLWAIADRPTRPWPRMTPSQVRAMLESADLLPALEAGGYRVPPPDATDWSAPPGSGR